MVRHQLERACRAGSRNWNSAARAGGEGHAQPFWYYAHLLAGGRSGALLCAAACIGLLLAIRRRKASPVALLAYYAIFIFILYSAIPYKTPWLALNFWLPMALLAGLAAETLWRVPVNHHG